MYVLVLYISVPYEEAYLSGLSNLQLFEKVMCSVLRSVFFDWRFNYAEYRIYTLFKEVISDMQRRGEPLQIRYGITTSIVINK